MSKNLKDNVTAKNLNSSIFTMFYSWLVDWLRLLRPPILIFIKLLLFILLVVVPVVLDILVGMNLEIPKTSLISKILHFFTFKNTQDPDALRTFLLTMHSGVGALLVGLVFFVAQQETNHQISMAKGIYIKESRVWSSAIGFIILYLFLLLTKLLEKEKYFYNTQLISVPFIFFALFLLFNLLKTIKVVRSDVKRSELEYNYMIRFYRKLANRSFTLQSSERNTFQIHPLEQLADEAKQAIKRQETALFALYRKIIIDIPKEYSTIINKRGSKPYDYNSALAKKWEGLPWHKKLFYELTLISVQVADFDLAQDVVSIPLTISWEAIRNCNQRMFAEYIRHLYYPAKLVDNSTNTRIRSLMIKTVAMWLRETGCFKLVPRMRDAESTQIEQFSNFFPPLFLTSQDLLKYFYDKRLKHEFLIVLDNFMDTLHYCTQKDWAFQKTYRSASVTSSFQHAMGKVLFYQYSILFGLSAWILKELNQTMEEKETCKDFLVTLFDHFKGFTLNEWTELFLRLQEFDTGMKMGWDLWEFGEFDTGVATGNWIGTDQYLKTLYISAVILNFIPSSGLDIETFSISEQPELKYYGFEPLLGEIDTGSIDPQLWSISSDLIAEKRLQLRASIESLKHGIGTQREIEVRNSPIDFSKIKNFKHRIFSTYSREEGLLDLYDYLNLLDYSTLGSSSELELGVLLKKDGFIADTNVIMDVLAEQIAGNIKAGQNGHLLKSYIKKLPTQNLHRFLNTIDLMSNAILLAPSRSLLEIDKDLRCSFTGDRWSNEGKWLVWANAPLYVGYITRGDKRIPVFRIFSPMQKQPYIAMEHKFLGKITISKIGVEDSNKSDHGLIIKLEEIQTEEQLDKIATQVRANVSREDLKNKVALVVRQRLRLEIVPLEVSGAVYSTDDNSVTD